MLKKIESSLYFCLMSFIVFLVGPTSFIIGLFLIYISYNIFPLWFFIILWMCYIFDIFFIQPQNSITRTSKKFKNWAGWNLVNNWFNFKIFTEDDMNIDQNKTYIFAIHPHGIFSWGCAIPLIDNLPFRNFNKKFSKINYCFVAASIVFKIPLIREICLMLGMIDASKNNIMSALKNNYSVGINIDGQAGVLSCKKGIDSVVLDNRKGFIKIALSTGSPIIPVYQFGLVDIYDTGPEFIKPFQRFFHKKLKWALPIFYSKDYGLLPYRNKPINIVVGNPINLPFIKKEDWGKEPAKETVEFYHKIYKNEIIKLYNKWKYNFGCGNRTLQIIDAYNPY